MPDEKERLELDAKTKAVFDRKGYDIQKRLAGGAFGQVYLAYSKKKDRKCAVKVMDLDKCEKLVREEFLPRELAALIQMKHPNAIEIYDIFKARNKIYIFMEFAPNGTILDYLKKKGALEEPFAAVWFRQTSEALNYMHTEVKMAHRDIKIENILLGYNNVAKLTDFGFAKKIETDSNGRPVMSKTFCGTEPYYSPQIVLKKDYDPLADDVWAMGVVLFMMVTYRFPFKWTKKDEFYKQQVSRNYKFPDSFRPSREIKELLWFMFEPTEKKRWTMRQVLDSRWVVKHKDQR